MARVRNVLIFVSVIAAFFSCGTKDNNDLPVFEVAYADFEDVLVTVGYVDPVRSVTVSCPQRLDVLIDFIVEDGTQVKKGDTICLLLYPDLETQYTTGMLEVEKIEADMEKTKIELAAQYAILAAQVQSNEADMAMAGLDSLQLEYLSPSQRRIKELEIKQARINNDKLKRKLRSLRAIQAADFAKLAANHRRIKSEVARAEAIIASLTITAPQDGLAMRATLRTTGRKAGEGDNVWNGMPLVTLPDVSAMMVKMDIPEIEYKQVNVGDSVGYTFDAMPGVVAGGKITYKAAVGKQLTNGSKVKFYEVHASLDDPERMPDPGFTANARIILKRVKDTLVVPQMAIFEQDSSRVAYVKVGRGYEAREVRTGIKSIKNVVVESGLAAGDIIALTKPHDSQIVGKVMMPADTTAVERDSIKVNTDSIKIKR